MEHLPGSARNIQLWAPGFFKAALARRSAAKPARVWVSICDHFEPYWGQPDDMTAIERVALWHHRWPEIAARHRDSADRPPRYTFFYPQEEYRPQLLDPLARLTQAGIADVEIHIHHDGQGERDFLDRMRGFRDTLYSRHGLLRESNGQVVFGFIHGNWALDNSRADGRYCGLNNEITLLRDLGCYADFTLPSAPDPAQTGVVNTIYWATDDPQRPRSHDTGVPVTPGGEAAGDLMLIPGPLCYNWRGRRRLLLPRIEIGELACYDRPTEHRVRLWLRFAPILGEDIFIKLFTHGTQERNLLPLLDTDLDQTFDNLRTVCAQQELQLYYCSAWEMFCAVEAIRQQRDPVSAVCRVGQADSKTVSQSH